MVSHQNRACEERETGKTHNVMNIILIVNLTVPTEELMREIHYSQASTTHYFAYSSVTYQGGKMARLRTKLASSTTKNPLRIGREGRRTGCITSGLGVKRITGINDAHEVTYFCDQALLLILS
jgi:hypothetical protein